MIEANNLYKCTNFYFLIFETLESAIIADQMGRGLNTHWAAAGLEVNYTDTKEPDTKWIKNRAIVWKNKLKCKVTYTHPDEIIFLIKKEPLLVFKENNGRECTRQNWHIISGKNMGWITVIETSNIKQVKYDQ